MSNLERIADRDLSGDTVWTERVSWLDRVPRAVSMVFVFAVFVLTLGAW